MKLEIVESGPKESAKGTILFVHGACHGAWCWENFTDYFAERGYRCLAMSFRGHGNSEGRDQLDEFGVDDYVEDIKQVVDSLDEAPIVVAHSLGGFVTERYMGLYPDTLKKAVLLCTMLPDGTSMGYQMKLLLKHFGPTKTMLDINNGKRPTPKQLANAVVFSGLITPEEAAPYVDLVQAESKRIVGDQAKPSSSNYDVGIPVEVIGCSNDWMFPDQSANANKYKTSPRMIDGLCHDCMLVPGWEKAAQEVERAIEA